MIKYIVAAIALIALTSPVAVTEDSTVIEGIQVPCNVNEDSLGCAYRALLDYGILEHPKPLSELRSAFNMTVPKVLRFI